jgi:hypothetical protein
MRDRRVLRRFLTKTPKAISNKPVTVICKPTKSPDGFPAVAAGHGALDALLCVPMKS